MTGDRTCIVGARETERAWDNVAMTSIDSSRPAATTRVIVLAAVVDVAMLILFAALGRVSHDSGHAVLGTLRVAAPFIIAYLIMAAIARLDRDPLSVRRAALIWIPLVVLGMLIRRFVFDGGTAPAFVIVAFVSTAVLLIGWRAMVALFRISRAA